MMIEVLMPDGSWTIATMEADLGFGWVRFHWSDGSIAIAAPNRWKKLDTTDANNQVSNG